MDFQKHARTRDNIVNAPEYILVEITEGPGKNIQIPGLPRAVVPLSSVKFWYNVGHERRVRLEQFALTLAYARTDFKAQVAWCSTRPPKTSTRKDAIDIALRPTFACHFTRHGIHS